MPQTVHPQQQQQQQRSSSALCVQQLVFEWARINGTERGQAQLRSWRELLGNYRQSVSQSVT